MAALLSPAILEALAVGSLPDVKWKHGDDLCDCTFQRIGTWTNPYLAETLEVRMCCIWNEIYKQYPEYVRTIPAYWDYNTESWETEPRAWDGEEDMPKAMWHRQFAALTGTSVAEVREMNLEAPKGKIRQPKPRMLLQWSGDWLEVELG